MVVGKQVISPELCSAAVERIHQHASDLSGGQCDLSDPITFGSLPTDSNNTSLLSRGFYELYHDDMLAQIRQSVRMYLHHVLIRGTPRLWTSYDRL